jgi:hypothetical protein
MVKPTNAQALVAATGLLMVLTWHAPAFGTSTYYVRPDGGSAEQCTGMSDAPYGGEGTGQDCAWDHPFRALPPGGTARVSGGDTLIIGQGGYRMGLNAPGAELCDAEAPRTCHMLPIPSGADPNSPTRVLGSGWDQGCAEPPELWGAEATDRIIDLTGSSHVEVACLELTDHRGCVVSHPKSSLSCDDTGPSYGDWAATAIYAEDSTGALLRNLNIHGLASAGIQAARLSDWTLEDVRIAANGWRGFDGNIGGTDSNSGQLTFRRWTVEWNGCSETWPGGNPGGCWGESDGDQGVGVRIGESMGTWVIEDSAFLHNTSDGLNLSQLLPGASVQIRRTKAEGNAGNQIRISAPTTIENAIVVGDCGFFEGQPFTFAVENCREQGNALALELEQGHAVTVVNSTITGEGNCLLSAGCTATADGSESVVVLNSIFQGQEQFVTPGEKTCLAFADACPADPFEIDYSIIADLKSGGCPGANDICNGTAGLANAQINKFDAHLLPQSPAIDSGLPVGGLVPADDFDGTARPMRNGVDRGAYESAVIPVHEEQVCRDEIRKRLTDFFRRSLPAMQECIDRVNRGEDQPPCPDGEAAEAIAQAASELDPEHMEAKCPSEVLATMTLGGECNGALAPDLVPCLLEEGMAAVETLISAEYSSPDGVLTSSEQQTCQATLAKRLGTLYAVKRLKLFNGCLKKRDRGSVGSCLDSVSQVRLDRIRKRVARRISRMCTDDLIVELQGGGGFGGGCASSTSVSDLVACEVAAHDSETDRLVEIVP